MLSIGYASHRGDEPWPSGPPIHGLRQRPAEEVIALRAGRLLPRRVSVVRRVPARKLPQTRAEIRPGDVWSWRTEPVAETQEIRRPSQNELPFLAHRSDVA